MNRRGYTAAAEEIYRCGTMLEASEVQVHRDAELSRGEQHGVLGQCGASVERRTHATRTQRMRLERRCEP